MEALSATRSTEEEAFVLGGNYTLGPYDFCLKLNRETGRLEGPGKDCKKGYLPAKEVTLKPYFIDRAEVMLKEYEACVKAKACPRITEKTLKESNTGCSSVESVRKRYPDGAMSCVNHAEAETYCKWKGKRLPTAAEWEVAGRGGDNRLFPWGDDFPVNERDTYTKFCRNDRPCHVREFGPYGPFKLFGMESGVGEWTSSSGCETYPTSCAPGQFGTRGGAYNYSRPIEWSVVDAGGVDGQLRFTEVGFRCARDATWDELPQTRTSAHLPFGPQNQHL